MSCRLERAGPVRYFYRIVAIASLTVYMTACTSWRGRSAPAAGHSRNPLDALAAGQITSAQRRGIPYVDDALTPTATRKASLKLETTLPAANYGRSAEGFFVRGGSKDEVMATLQGQPLLGNRSLLAQLSFRSTQTGVASGEHGLVELRLVVTNAVINGQRLEAVRIRVENGRFYALDLRGTVIAGNASVPAFEWQPNTDYVLSVLLFEKGVWCRLSGENLPGGHVDIALPDTKRWIPNPPGFALWASALATGGKLIVHDWLVTPVGPADAALGAIGDSITAGLVDAPETDSYVHQVSSALGQAPCFNTGSGGASTAQDAARFSYELAPFKPRVVWIEGGTNDLSAGASARAIWDNWQREMDMAKQWGGRAVLSTVPPRASFVASQNKQRIDLNERLRQSGLPFVDRDAAVRDAVNLNVLDAAYDSGDGTHLNAVGNARIATEALKVIPPLTDSADAL